MDIFSIAEENLFVSLGTVFGVGLIQGLVLGRGIRKRFPGLKSHARIVSVLLLVLLAANAIAGTLEFASPDKTSLSELSIPETAKDWQVLLFDIIGLNTGLGTAIATFVSIALMLLFRSASLPGVARYFVFGISVITVSVFLIARFTDYVPSIFQVMLYAAYQLGITIGVFAVTSRGKADDSFEY